MQLRKFFIIFFNIKSDVENKLKIEKVPSTKIKEKIQFFFNLRVKKNLRNLILKSIHNQLKK